MTKSSLIVMVLDRSGSMDSIRDDTIGGINAFLEEQKRLPGKCWFTLAQFDNVYELVHHNIPLESVAPLTRETFLPRGSTALLDAMGRTLNTIEADVASFGEADRPEKVYFVTVTDGAENASREFTREQIFKMITDRRNKSGWEFIFLAANQDAIAAGTSLGVSLDASINYTADSASTRGSYDVVSNHIAGSRATGKSISFTDQDRKRALGK